MIYLVAFVVLILATARLTRLIYFDDLTLPLRLWIDRRFGTNSFFSKLIWCPWCVGVWASMFTSSVALGVFNRIHGDDMPWDAQAGTLLLLILATAYPASWIVDFETSRISEGN